MSIPTAAAAAATTDIQHHHQLKQSKMVHTVDFFSFFPQNNNKHVSMTKACCILVFRGNKVPAYMARRTKNAETGPTSSLSDEPVSLL